MHLTFEFRYPFLRLNWDQTSDPPPLLLDIAMPQHPFLEFQFDATVRPLFPLPPRLPLNSLHIRAQRDCPPLCPPPIFGVSASPPPTWTSANPQYEQPRSTLSLSRFHLPNVAFLSNPPLCPSTFCLIDPPVHICPLALVGCCLDLGTTVGAVRLCSYPRAGPRLDPEHGFTLRLIRPRSPPLSRSAAFFMTINLDGSAFPCSLDIEF